MPAVTLSPVFKWGFGVPEVGSKLYTYLAGTTTPAATYTNAAGNVANSNPVVADAEGLADIWIPYGIGMKVALHDPDDALIWTVDNILIPTPPGSGSVLPTPAEYELLTGTFTAASFSGQGAITLPGFFSAGQQPVLTMLTVTSTFGASNGLSELTLGDTEIMDRYATNMSRTTGAKQQQTQPFPVWASAMDLILFSLGGTFDATGAADVQVLVQTIT